MPDPDAQRAVEDVEVKLVPVGCTRERALELLGEVGLAGSRPGTSTPEPDTGWVAGVG